MNHRLNATLAGVFYIVAAVASIIAVVLYTPIMTGDWHIVVENGQRISVLFGVLSDVLLIFSAVGTAVMLAPYLLKTSRHLSLAYFSLRFMEAVFIAIGVVSILALVSLSDGYAAGELTNTETLSAIGIMWQGVHRWIMVLGPNLMLGINTLIYSYLLHQSNLVPKLLAKSGMVVAVMVFIAGLLDFFGVIEPWSTTKAVLALPLGVYEISLAIYLIAKGFKKEGLNNPTFNH